MATTLKSAQIPEPFSGLLPPVKVVQDVIEEGTENKVSLFEKGASVTLYLDNPTLSNGVDISSANNFMALSESYFIVKMKYSVNDKRTAPTPANTSNGSLRPAPVSGW